MPNVVRQGDRFVGSVHHGQSDCPHYVTGSFIQGAVKTNVNGSSAVRVDDVGLSTNPHNPRATALSGGANFIEGKPVHRLGDKVDLGAGIGDSIQASPNVLSK
ncbi:hypothetical protein DRO66_01850 [Candidatus Bathyarchaeota archaeon]|nr:MAG: hypothetical protein DRO66_01850 [Candidatus Bathyarchaeota archaeon]